MTLIRNEKSGPVPCWLGGAGDVRFRCSGAEGQRWTGGPGRWIWCDAEGGFHPISWMADLAQGVARPVNELSNSGQQTNPKRFL